MEHGLEESGCKEVKSERTPRMEAGGSQSAYYLTFGEPPPVLQAWF